MIKKGTIYILFFAIVILAFANNLSGYNYEGVNVTSKVNVTNAFPAISKVTMGTSIDLAAGANKSVKCNVTVYDYNGYQDIKSVNATIWHNLTSAMNETDNVSNHYTNVSCTNISQSGYYANYTCSFDVVYYAYNGTWVCNASVIDNSNFTGYLFNTSTVNPLYALNVSSVVDYGDMILGETSNNITANITNFGNLPINVSVRGFGGNNSVTGANYAMLCQSGNITIGNQRFSTDPNADWSSKTQLSSNLQNMTNMTIPVYAGATNWNATYWQLYVDPTNNPWGLCTGTIEFTAIAG